MEIYKRIIKSGLEMGLKSRNHLWRSTRKPTSKFLILTPTSVRQLNWLTHTGYIITLPTPTSSRVGPAFSIRSQSYQSLIFFVFWLSSLKLECLFHKKILSVLYKRTSNSEKRKKIPFYKVKSLVGLTPGYVWPKKTAILTK